MPHDKRGTELQVGDVVMVPCRVRAIHLTADYCNVDLETVEGMPPKLETSTLTLNSRQTIKPTATHRFAEYPASSPVLADAPQPLTSQCEATYTYGTVHRCCLPKGHDYAHHEKPSEFTWACDASDKIKAAEAPQQDQGTTRTYGNGSADQFAKELLAHPADAPALSEPKALEQQKLSLHRCKVCDTRWLLWPAGVGGTKDASWNLLDPYSDPGSCCDNVAMGDQIEHLRDLPLTVSQDESLAVVHARKQGAADGFQTGWHAALQRIREGDSLDDLAALTPKPSSGVSQAPEQPQERLIELARLAAGRIHCRWKEGTKKFRDSGHFKGFVECTHPDCVLVRQGGSPVLATPQEPLDADTERKLREYLWIGHGHLGQYGDDGEMQCSACAPMWDYRRAPLADVIRQAIKARFEVNIAALQAQAASSPVLADPPKDARAQGDDLAREFTQKFPFPSVNLGSAGISGLGAWFHTAMQMGGEMVRQESPVLAEAPPLQKQIEQKKADAYEHRENLGPRGVHNDYEYGRQEGRVQAFSEVLDILADAPQQEKP